MTTATQQSAEIGSADPAWQAATPTTARQAAQQGLERLGLGLSGGLALVAALLLVATPDSGVLTPPMLIAFLVATASVSIFLAWWARAPLGVPSWLIGVVLATANLVAVLRFKQVGQFIGWWSVVELVAVAAVVCVAIIPWFWVSLVGVIGVIVVLGAAALADTDPDGLFVTEDAAIAATGRLVAVGLATLGLAVGTRRSGRRVDDEMASSAAEAIEEKRAQLQERARQERRRLAHDTALNTLEAVASGVGRAHPSATRQRCAEDVARWREAMPIPQRRPLPQDLAVSLQSVLLDRIGRARRFGLQISVSGSAVTVVSTEVAEAIGSAVEEALRNAAKHAQVDQVSVSIGGTEDGAHVTVLDRGIGFNTAGASGMGLDQSVRARLAEVGARVALSSEAGGGTSVMIAWRAQRFGSRDRTWQGSSATVRMRSNLVRVLTILVLGLGLLSVASIVSEASTQTGSAWALAAATLAMASSLWVLWLAGQGPIALRHTLLLGLSSASILLLTPVADPYCAAAMINSPLADLRVLPLAVAAILLPHVWANLVNLGMYTAAAGIAAWLAAQFGPSCGPTLLAMVAVAWVVVPAMLGYGLLLRHQIQASGRAHQQRAEHLLHRAQVEANQAARAEFEGAISERAQVTLSQIADGLLDPADPGVQSRAGHDAVQLRSVVMATGFGGPVGSALSSAIDWSSDRGQRVRISGSTIDPVYQEGVDEAVADAFLRLIELMPTRTKEFVVTLATDPKFNSLLIQAVRGADPADPDAVPDELLRTFAVEASPAHGQPWGAELWADDGDLFGQLLWYSDPSKEEL